MLPTTPRIWIAVSFPSSKGARYPFAVLLARAADLYQEDQVGKGMIHVAGFRDRPDSIQRAIALLEYAGSIRGCMVSNGSSIWSSGRTLRALRCYLGATGPAYCLTPYESPFCVFRLGASPCYLPCKLIEGYFIRNWHTTGTVADQLQAAAVEAGCEWCPLWRPVLHGICTAQPAHPVEPPLKKLL